MKRSALALVLAVLSLTACGTAPDSAPGMGGNDVPVSDPEAPVTMTPAPGDDLQGGVGHPKRTRPRPGMADLRQVAWEKARETPSGRSLRVTYWSGVEPCNVLDHVDVEYATSDITVTLYEGHDPDAGDVACIEIALQKVVHVQLEEPVDGRKILDGSKGQS